MHPELSASYGHSVVVLARVNAEERQALRAQLSDYLEEFAEMEGVEVETADDGTPVYRWFDHYWRDEHRLPFFIEAAGTAVGFCLIRVIDDGWNVAEFAICRERRREGLGRAAVGAIASAAEKAGKPSSRRRARVERTRAQLLDVVWLSASRRGGWHRFDTAYAQHQGVVQSPAPAFGSVP